MLLLEHPLSSYVQKVKIALREKDTPFTVEIPQDLGSGRSGGRSRQRTLVLRCPVLIDGPHHIFDSTVIMEYIEERWPDPPLMPRDPAARAFARITEDVCDTTRR
jgi:RNA polymerase-associated protein